MIRNTPHSVCTHSPKPDTRNELLTIVHFLSSDGRESLGLKDITELSPVWSSPTLWEGAFCTRRVINDFGEKQWDQYVVVTSSFVFEMQ